MSFGKMKITLALVLVMMAVVGLAWSEALQTGTTARLSGASQRASTNGTMVKGDVDTAVTGSKKEWSVHEALYQANGARRDEAACGCVACTCNGASTCPIDLGAGSTYTTYWTAADAPYGVTVTAYDFDTTDGSTFDILALNEADYYLYKSGKAYSYFVSWSTTGATCFQGPTNFYTTQPGFYVVVTCKNWVQSCPLRFRARASMRSPPSTPVTPPPPISVPPPPSSAPLATTSFAAVLAIVSIAFALLSM